MLELMLLYRLCGWIGNVAREKGQSAISYQLMLILYWIGGELVTSLVVSVVFTLLFGHDFSYLFVYILAYIGGALGAGYVFKIVSKLPDLKTTEVFASDVNA